jgi:hypothetical protein
VWVVLEWLESLQFIKSHANSHYASGDEWHAQQFTPAFAHRARVFYELAEKGWDWRLCGGGMTWNPRLLPYKNAITNQLFISASVSMYLHYPGDTNRSPFASVFHGPQPGLEELPDQKSGHRKSETTIKGPYDHSFLTNAYNGYEWLKNSNMTNAQGLYTDGFHISGYRQNKSRTVCDERNEMVYTYNQGVILSGLRGLWEGTGHTTYLDDGHELVRNVISATGWGPHRAANSSKEMDIHWHGLGSNGILTELCEPSATCSQDSQTFKGIFFHHLTAFCTPLPRRSVKPGRTYGATKELASLHHESCDAYTSWVVHNAQAALRTRDDKGQFGERWGADYQEDEQLYTAPDAKTSKPSIVTPICLPWTPSPPRGPTGTSSRPRAIRMIAAAAVRWRHKAEAWPL